MNLLLTGFEPFGGAEINPSEQVARVLDGSVIAGCQVVSCILPVDRAAGPRALLDAVAARNPRAVVCLGEHSGLARVAVERVAVNLLDFRIADNAGEVVTDQPVFPGGPAAYFATLPVRAIHQAVTAMGIPCELSLSAGSFLCNQVMYTLLHHAASSPGLLGGFIHLPALPSQAAKASRPLPSMSVETSASAVFKALEMVALALA